MNVTSPDIFPLHSTEKSMLISNCACFAFPNTGTASVPSSTRLDWDILSSIRLNIVCTKGLRPDSLGTLRALTILLKGRSAFSIAPRTAPRTHSSIDAKVPLPRMTTGSVLTKYPCTASRPSVPERFAYGKPTTTCPSSSVPILHSRRPYSVISPWKRVQP